MKKKIIFFLQNFVVGGAEKNIINYANFLSKKNLDVYILTLSNECLLKKSVSQKVKLINLKKRKLIFSILKIYKIIKKLKPDFLFSALLHISLLLTFFKKYKLIQSKLIIRPSNIIFNDHFSAYNLKKNLIKFLTKIYLKYGDLFFCISKDINKKLKLLKIDKKKIRTIRNAIIDKDFYKKSKIPLDRKFLRKADYLLAVGRLTDQKNHLMLIRAFSLIKKKYKKKLFLVIIGEGFLKKKYETLIEEKGLKNSVLIFKNMPDVKNYIYYSKLFIQTSLWEGQPNVLYEAIILNKRVLSTKCPGQSNSYLSNYKNCFLLKRNTEQELAKSILFFLKNKNQFNFSKKKYEEYRIKNSAEKILNEIKKN